jgi:hypothetical protein
MASYTMTNEKNSYLVLCIEEYDHTVKSNKNMIDTRMFLYYDMNEDIYYVTGKRCSITKKNGKQMDFDPFSFKSDTKKHLVEFVKMIVDKDEKCCVKLYNYSDIMDFDYSHITFDILKKHMSMTHEITGYDNVFLSRPSLYKYLTLMKNLYNDSHIDSHIDNDDEDDVVSTDYSETEVIE